MKTSRTAQASLTNELSAWSKSNFLNFDLEKSALMKIFDDVTRAHHENHMNFPTDISTDATDPTDPNWVSYLHECRQRFAYRLSHTITANEKSLFFLNNNLKILNVLPSVTNWEQFTVWNNMEKKIQTLRVTRKREISNKFRTSNIIKEKNLMFCCEFPFLLDFHFHFQTTSLLCMLVEQLPGGTLENLVKKTGKIPFRKSQFYASQIVLALEYVHTMGIILRDLRLENVVIGKDGYVKLVDFGNSILMTESTENWYENNNRPGIRNVTSGFGFQAPEIFLKEKFGKEIDWWSFGLILYKLYSGKDCFSEEPSSQFYEEQMKRKILDLHYDTPRWFTAIDRKIFKEFLKIEPKNRLGSLPDGVLTIKNHPWFRGVSWISIYGGLDKAPEIPLSTLAEEDPGENFIKFPEESEKISGIKNPFPFGYQFQKF